MINFFAFTGFLNFIVSVFLGILVYLKGKRQFQSRSFILYFFAVAFWSFGYYFWQISTTEGTALFWSRLLTVGAIFIPVFYFNFIVDFLNLSKIYKRVLYEVYALSFIFLLLNFTSYFVKGVESAMFFPFWPKPGIFYSVFLFSFFSLVFYGWYLLIDFLKKIEEKIKKQQVKYFLLGTGIGFAGGSTNYFLWYDIPIAPYGNILVIFGVLLVAFAILKYHLFEIRVIATELLVGAMGITLFVLPFLMPAGNLRVLTIVIFFLFSIFAFYLVKVTHEEERRREEAEIIAIKEKSLRYKTEKLAKEIQKLNETKTQFMLATQHHLRTPLTAIQGYLSMLSEGIYGDINRVAKLKIKSAFESTQKLIRLVNEFLDVAQFEVGKDIIAKTEIQISDAINDIVEELKQEAAEKNLYLKFKKGEIILPKIMADPEKIKEAFYNVIHNAIKYTQEGGVIVSLHEGGDKRSITVAVRDTGIGMEKEETENLFNKTFERGAEAKRVYTTGRGIGLYLASQIIKAHNGKIRVESKGKYKGSAFFIELPIK